MHNVNVNGLSIILSEIIKYPNIKFLHVSSAGIYGIETHYETVLTENSGSYPNNTYERTKQQAEKLLIEFEYKSGLHYSILRPSNVFGENDTGLKLLNLFKGLKKDRFFFINPNAVVNYVYVKQVTYVIKQLIEKNVFENKIYNVNAACTISEFIFIIKKALDISTKTKRIPLFLSFFIKIICKIADRLPVKYQYINSGKYRELTAEKYYSTEELRKVIPMNEKEILNTGIHNLVKHYKEKGLL
jgi:nucleoside-diphosphate-sugar epimerase